MEQTPNNLRERNDHVLDILNDNLLGNNVELRNSQEPAIQSTPGGSSHGSFSRNGKPQAPLSTWIVGYAAGCAACIPILFQHCFLPYPTLSRLLDHFYWVLKAYCFVWFIVGNVWLFGGYSASGASNLHRLCIMFIVFNYVEFTMPFILWVGWTCCCRHFGLIRGAPSECIDSLPTYTFKLQKDGIGSVKKINSEVKGETEAAGAEKGCAILGDDAVCCICLTSYADNDVLKELHCSHFFHKSCVDKWLKMTALCPLCKCTILSKK